MFADTYGSTCHRVSFVVVSCWAFLMMYLFRYMIIDALMEAEPYLHIAQRIFDPKKFLYLTDSIMDRIQESTEPVRCHPLQTFTLHMSLMYAPGTRKVAPDLPSRHHP
jgi:hypothetical protein